MHNASISFQSFLMFMQKKAKCATSNQFQKRKYFYNFLFQRRERVENTQQFSLQKDKKLCDSFEMHRFETITKVK